jgi:ribonuclease HI
MPWTKMRFRDQEVWVRVDVSGRPVLDGGGRAEMKYRETDEKSYRPGSGNLTPIEGAPTTPRDLAPPARRNARGPAKAPALPDKLPGAIDVWTDGACSGNPGPMGIGVVVLYDGQRRELGEYLGVGTNNIAELTAIERGLDIAVEITRTAKESAKAAKAEAKAEAEGKADGKADGSPAGGGGDAGARMRRVRVYSDSGYAIGLLEKGWKAKANQELVARVRKRVASVPNLEFVKVPGHAGVPENERCDELARNAIVNAR